MNTNYSKKVLITINNDTKLELECYSDDDYLSISRLKEHFQYLDFGKIGTNKIIEIVHIIQNHICTLTNFKLVYRMLWDNYFKNNHVTDEGNQTFRNILQENGFVFDSENKPCYWPVVLAHKALTLKQYLEDFHISYTNPVTHIDPNDSISLFISAILFEEKENDYSLAFIEELTNNKRPE